jgi:preprotein translocase subunit SecE
MGAETKRMAKPLAAAADNESLGGRLKSWPERVRVFYNDVRTEMKKVTAPSLKEVRSTTAVVIIAVFFFAAFFWVVDMLLSHSLDALFHYFAHR